MWNLELQDAPTDSDSDKDDANDADDDDDDVDSGNKSTSSENDESDEESVEYIGKSGKPAQLTRAHSSYFWKTQFRNNLKLFWKRFWSCFFFVHAHKPRTHKRKAIQNRFCKRPTWCFFFQFENLFQFDNISQHHLQTDIKNRRKKKEINN